MAIVVASGKGGVGKTSVVAGVSSCLAALGNRVLCIDADFGLRNLDIVLGLSDRTVLDLEDVLNGSVSLEEAVVEHEEIPGLFLLNAPLSAGGMPVSGEPFAALIKEAEERYDYILVDCAAGLGNSLRMAAGACEYGIVVSTTDLTSLRDAARTGELMLGLGVRELRLVVNRVRRRLIDTEGAPNIDDAIDATGIRLIGIVPEDENVMIYANRSRPIILHTYSGAARAYLNISKRITGEKVPVMKIKYR